MKCLGLVLAAGKSRRFGNANKLLASFHKKPLVSFAIDAMVDAELDHRIALIEDPNLDYLFEGFEILRPLSANAGLGENLSVGAAYAKKIQATHVLITLGDMPFITAKMIDDIKNSCPDQGISIAKGSRHISVPACFHSSYFDQLIALDGDKGAGMIAKSERNTNYVSMKDEQLRDVDTIDELKNMQSAC